MFRSIQSVQRIRADIKTPWNQFECGQSIEYSQNHNHNKSKTAGKWRNSNQDNATDQKAQNY